MEKYTITVTDNETNETVHQSAGSIVLALVLNDNDEKTIISKFRVWEDKRRNIALAICKLKEYAKALDKEVIGDDFFLRLAVAEDFDSFAGVYGNEDNKEDADEN